MMTHLPGLLQVRGPLLLQNGLDSTDEFCPYILNITDMGNLIKTVTSMCERLRRSRPPTVFRITFCSVLTTGMTYLEICLFRNTKGRIKRNCHKKGWPIAGLNVNRLIETPWVTSVKMSIVPGSYAVVFGWGVVPVMTLSKLNGQRLQSLQLVQTRNTLLNEWHHSERHVEREGRVELMFNELTLLSWKLICQVRTNPDSHLPFVMRWIFIAGIRAQILFFGVGY